MLQPQLPWRCKGRAGSDPVTLPPRGKPRPRNGGAAELPPSSEGARGPARNEQPGPGPAPARPRPPARPRLLEPDPAPRAKPSPPSSAPPPAPLPAPVSVLFQRRTSGSQAPAGTVRRCGRGWNRTGGAPEALLPPEAPSGAGRRPMFHFLLGSCKLTVLLTKHNAWESCRRGSRAVCNG